MVDAGSQCELVTDGDILHVGNVQRGVIASLNPQKVLIVIRGSVVAYIQDPSTELPPYSVPWGPGSSSMASTSLCEIPLISRGNATPSTN